MSDPQDEPPQQPPRIVFLGDAKPAVEIAICYAAFALLVALGAAAAALLA